MIKYYNKLFICAVLFFSISFAQPGVARAESPLVDKLATVLPDDVLVFAATSGGEHLKPAFEKSSLGRMWYDPGVQTFYQSIKKEVLAKIKQEIPNSNDAKVPDIVMDFVKLVGSRPIIIGAARKAATEGPPVYGFAILDAGTRKAEIASAITKMEALADEGDIAEIKVGSFMMHGPKDDADVPGYWGWVGNYLVFAVNDREGLALKYLQKPRAAAASYLKEVSGTSDVLAVYVDCQKITEVVSAVADQEGAKDQFCLATAVIKELGFANVKTIAARAGFAGPDVVCNELIEVPQPRTGLLACFKSINLKMFDMVDARAVNAAAVNCDIGGVYDTIMRTIKVAAPNDIYTEIQQEIAKFESEAKFKIRKELLESLSGPMIFYSLPAGVMMEAPSGGFVVIAKPKDAALLEKTMVSLGKFAATQSEDMLQVSSQVQSDGRTLHSWMIAPLEILPCWTVVDDHIVIASNMALYNAAVKQVVSAGPGKKSLRTTEGYQKAIAKVADNLIFLRYTDSKVQFTQLMTTLQQSWPMVTMVATEAGVKLPVMLPSVGDIVKDMGPSCQYAWFDAQGLRSHYRGPGVEMSLGSVAGASLGAGIMMPALFGVRQVSTRIVSGTNLSAIGKACLIYANDYEDKFPPNLQELVEKAELSPKCLESPRKPKDFDGPSYIYIAGQTTSMEPGNIIAYENPEFCSDKINVLFLDSHVQAMKPDEFLRELEATYKRLGREMPEIKFKDSTKPGIPKKFPARSLKLTDKLDLSGSQITDADLARRLEGLTSLRELRLQDANITDAGLVHLKDLTSLELLYLGATRISDVGLGHIKNLTALQHLCVHKTQVTDAGLAHLKDLTSLQSLCLHDTQVSDAGLAHLKDLTSLETLRLENTQVSDAGLMHLKDVSQLKLLHLHATAVTDAGLLHLKGLTNLQHLDLGKTQLTDAGLAQLKGLTNLKGLNLNWTEVTDEGLVHLQGLYDLEWLNLYGTQVSDAGLTYLTGMTKLQTLYLNNTLVTDAGLAHLKDLTSLRQLHLAGTKVTTAGVAELKEVLPNCRFSGPGTSTVSQAEGPLIGQRVPSFTLQDLDGKEVSLSDFKGKVVLLDFWATWCGPCVRAIPHLEALHKKYKDEGLVVIGINHERDHDKVKAFGRENISYIILLDADEQFKEYGIKGIPTAFYIDREGKIRYRDVGFGTGKAEEMEQKVKELLAGKEEPKRVVDPMKEVLEEEGKVLAFDDFDGKLSLDWEILHVDLSHISLTKKPGTLTITTQKGDFYRSATNLKNLFLIDNPVAGGGDFQITTCIVAFAPTANYHQAGLVCFNDKDNYVKWTYEWNGARGQRVFALIRETQGSVSHTYVLDISKAERVWLRLSKRGNRYTYSTSTDGKSFRVHGELPWGDGVPKSVGLVAANADNLAPEIDASFDFFEVRALATESLHKAAAEDKKKPSEPAESPPQQTEPEPKAEGKSVELTKSLHEAASEGDLEKVKKLIISGADINAKDNKQQPPLYLAVQSGQTDMAALLIARGADVNVKGGRWWTPLHITARFGHTDIAELLIAKGANVNANGGVGWTPLHLAVRFGNTDMAKLLVAKDANMYASTKEQMTPLLFAVLHDRKDIEKLLIEKGAEKGIFTETIRGNTNGVKRFLIKDPNLVHAEQGHFTPLHWAAYRGHLETAKLLIRKGADIEAGREYVPPLYWAVRYNRPDMAKLLIAKGADVNTKGQRGITVLHYAPAIEVAETLIEEGANVNAQDNRGASPLHYIVSQSGHRAVLKLLIDFDDDISAVHSEALHLEAEKGQAAVAELLIAKGADVNAKDKKGLTPLDIAGKLRYKTLSEVLRKYRAKTR